jgi:hypothetical protein
MTTNDITTGAAIIRLDDAVTSVYAAMRAIGFGVDPIREAVLAQVADTITTLAYECDGVPLPADVDTDDDSGGGGVYAR